MEQTELELLKERADQLGLEYHTNIGVDRLRERVNTALEEDKPKKEVNEHTKRKDVYEECMKLKRVVVVPMNPDEATLPSEDFIVSSKYLGDVWVNVPFNVEWHVPKVIVDLIRSKQFVKIVNRRGSELPEVLLVPRYGVTELEALSEKEIKQIVTNIHNRG